MLGFGRKDAMNRDTLRDPGSWRIFRWTSIREETDMNDFKHVDRARPSSGIGHRVPVVGRVIAVMALVGASGGLALASAPTGASAAPAAQNADPAEKPFITFYSGGADTFLRSPKDRWLLESVHRLETNGIELPPEARQGFESEPQNAIAARMIRDLLTTRIAGSIALSAAEGGGPPMPRGQVLFMGNARRPGALIERDIMAALKLSGADGMFRADPANRGMMVSQEQEGAPRAWIGTLDVAGTSATAFSVGDPPQATPPSFAAFGLKPGVDPQFALEFDLGPLQPFLGMASVMLPQGPDGHTPLEQFGIVSPTPMVIRIVGTNDGTEGRIDGRMVNAVKAMKVEDAERALVLRPADLQWVPADATFVSIGRRDIAAMLNASIDQYNAQAELFGGSEDDDFDDMDGDDGMGADDDDGMGGGHGGAGAAGGEGEIDAWVQEHLGLNLRRDLIAPLGDLALVQSSRSLGGGLLGGAYVITLKDSATMKTSLARMAGALGNVQDAKRVGFAMRARTHPGCDALYSLSFAGLPIPVQGVIGIGNGALVMGLSTQAVTSAIAQAKASTSIRDNANFKLAGAPALLEGANGLMWLDAPRMVAGGYGVVLAAATAADSALLPQSGGPTALQAMVPSLTELEKDARPMLVVTRYEGDDLAWTYRCDGSFTVQLAAVGSLFGGAAFMQSAFATGLLMPALTRARSAAREVKAATELREVGMALMIHSHEHEGSFPATLDELVANGYLGEHGALVNPRTAPGLNGDYEYRPPSREQHSSAEVPVAWEGYHAWPAGGIMVLFADGHVAKVDPEARFLRMIGQ